MQVIVPRLLLNLREAAQALSVSDRTLWGMSAPRGPIPVVKLGCSIRYEVRALEEYIQAQTQRGGD